MATRECVSVKVALPLRLGHGLYKLLLLQNNTVYMENTNQKFLDVFVICDYSIVNNYEL